MKKKLIGRCSLPIVEVRRGDIFLAEGYVFPHERTSASVSKPRPVVILQHDADNRNLRYPFVVAAPLTSRKVDAIFPQDVYLPQGAGGLPLPSKVLVGLILALEKKALIRKVGHLDVNHLGQIDVVLRRLVGLEPSGEQKWLANRPPY